MKSSIIAVALTALLSLPLTAGAHDSKQDVSTKTGAVDDTTKPVVAVVDQFSTALRAADYQSVRNLLDDDVLILESGGAERSREEYMSDHAIQDALFLRDARSEIKHRTVRVAGGLAWVGTESELHAMHDGKPMTLLSTETMVLKQTNGDWRIVHIHWSSRTKKES
jgi:uncharacterized protein (TIGR02246 family)